MDVHALTLHIAEADLNTLARKFLPVDAPLEDLAIEIRPEGVCVKGVYPMLVNVSFESWWQVSAKDGKIVANMTRLKAFGMPAMVFKSAILKALGDLAGQENWFQVRGEDVHIDAEYLIAREACPVKLNLRRVECGAGVMMVQAGV